ncbi:MAG TPA: hypothetical protein VFO12_05905, partial [Sphingomicrobium sp.]|nr:hypothetical protein [Sphingomicrobium sp.]
MGDRARRTSSVTGSDMNMAGNWPPRARARRLQIFVSDFSATGVVRNAIALANEASASGYQV